MKKPLSLLMLFTILVLSACSLDENATELYKIEQPIEIELTTPNSVNINRAGKIEAVLTQNGETVDSPNFVHFQIWKQDGTVSYGMEDAVYDGNGTYSITKEFPSDGLYYVQVHAKSNGALILPKKQFVIGELTEEDLLFLKNNAGEKEAPLHEGHH